MRGSDRRGEFLVTTDLLTVWTDPDTAMEAVGASLGVLGDHDSDARNILSSDAALRDELYAALFSLVDVGALEKRACADGRFAFRWRPGMATAATSPDAGAATIIACLASLHPSGSASAATVVDGAVAELAPPVAVPVVAPRSPEGRRWPRAIAPVAPLALPALSCVLALLAFVWLDRTLALATALVLVLVGVVGLVRRVPFAGFWTVGVILASLLLRLS